MHRMVNLNKKILLFFSTFIGFCLSTNDTEECYDIDEYREYFMKKSLDLYNKETKNLPSQPISIEFAYLMFYDNRLGFAIESISKYFESKSSKIYSVNIYTPDYKTKFPYEDIIFKTVQLEQIYNSHTWSVSFIRSPSFSDTKESLRHSRNILSQKGFKFFLFYLCQMYKCIRKAYDIFNSSSSYISIEDIGNEISKKIPKKYQDLNSKLVKNKYDVFCIKIFSEVEITDQEIDKSKMIKIFFETFGRFTYYFFGNYCIYLIDVIKFESFEEDTCTHKITMRTRMKQYIIFFKIVSPSDPNYDNRILHSGKKFSFNSSIHNTEFKYLFSGNNKDENDYKFKILLKHSYITFEFNFNWYNSEPTIKKYLPNSSIYLCVSVGNNYYVIELLRNKNRKYFMIKNISGSSIEFHSSWLDYNNHKIEYNNRIYEIKEFFDCKIFESDIYIHM